MKSQHLNHLLVQLRNMQLMVKVITIDPLGLITIVGLVPHVPPQSTTASIPLPG